MKKLIKESEVESCNKKIELFQVEELDGRFELKSWFHDDSVNMVCTMFPDDK